MSRGPGAGFGVSDGEPHPGEEGEGTISIVFKLLIFEGFLLLFRTAGALVDLTI